MFYKVSCEPIAKPGIKQMLQRKGCLFVWPSSPFCRSKRPFSPIAVRGQNLEWIGRGSFLQHFSPITWNQGHELGLFQEGKSANYCTFNTLIQRHFLLVQWTFNLSFTLPHYLPGRWEMFLSPYPTNHPLFLIEFSYNFWKKLVQVFSVLLQSFSVGPLAYGKSLRNENTPFCPPFTKLHGLQRQA